MKNDKKKLFFRKDKTHKKYQGIGIKKRIMALVVAASMGISGTGIVTEKFSGGEVIIAKALDLSDDIIEGGIPVYLNDETSASPVIVPSDSLIISKEKIDNQKDEMVTIIAISDKGEQILGKTYVKYLYVLNVISEEKLEKYNTIYTVTADDVIMLKDKASSDSKVIAKILSDEQVLGTEEITVANNNEIWKSILYISGNEFKEGYVESEYLKKLDFKDNQIYNNDFESKDLEDINGNDIKEEKEEKLDYHELQTVLNNKTVSESGNVVGIDISNWFSPEQLRSLLMSSNQIDKYTEVETYSGSGNYISTDTRNISGKINYVYIKIGASAYGDDKPFRILKSEIYKEQVAVCEELGIPYGFYYYSTAITSEEAEQEANTFIELVDSIEKRDYNILPPALDIEVVRNDGDRQLGKNLSYEKSVFTNIVSAKLGPVLLYTGGGIVLGDDKTIDYEEYKSYLDIESLGIWLASPREVNGNYSDLNLSYLESLGKDVLVRQDVLDAKLITSDNNYKVDINIIDEDVFDQLIKEGVVRKGITQKQNSAKEINKDGIEWEL